MPDRKYRHRGYMDEGGAREERDRAPRPEGPRPPRPEGPRGRGLGAPTETVFRCRSCGAKQVATGALALDATCGKCQADLHCCSNCLHFDPARPNECRKPILARVASKAKRNTCELFTPNAVQEFASDKAATSSDPRAAFDSLFKK